jgi:hypothetical protein
MIDIDYLAIAYAEKSLKKFFSYASNIFSLHNETMPYP